VSNVEILRTDQKWRWIGHIERKQGDHLTKEAFRWSRTGKRKRGRPRQTWKRVVEEEAESAIGFSYERTLWQAGDRRRWQRVVAAVSACKAQLA
jgi:hypothetical protein